MTLGTAVSVIAAKGFATFTSLSLSQTSGPVTLVVSSVGMPGTSTDPVRVTMPVPPPTQPPTSGTGGASLPSLVHITDVRFLSSPAHQVTQIVIVFSGALDPSSANNKANYRLKMAGKKGSYTAKNATNLTIRSALMTRQKTP